MRGRGTLIDVGGRFSISCHLCGDYMKIFRASRSAARRWALANGWRFLGRWTCSDCIEEG
jgi:hypothetical protein